MSKEDSTSEMKRKLQSVYLLAEAASCHSFKNYMNHIVIDSKPDAKPFRAVAEPWQWTLYSRLAPMFEKTAGVVTDYKGPMSSAIVLPKGHNKTGMLGSFVTWSLAFAQRQILGYAFAADRDQAALIRSSAERELELNPWLQKHVEIQNYRLYGKHSSCFEILSADAASSHGLRPDILICDEVTHWPERGAELFHSILTSRTKIPNSTFLITTNAGILNSWQHQALEKFKSSPNWWIYQSPGKLASWISTVDQDDMRKVLPPSVAARLYDNKWVSSSVAGEFATREEVERCIDFDLTLQPKGDPELSYIGTIDYGATRDRTVMCIMHTDPLTNNMIIDRMDVLQGSRENPVKIFQIEEWIETNRTLFDFSAIIIDPWNLEGVFQKFQGYLPMEKFEFRSGKGNQELCVALRNAIVQSTVKWYRGCGMILLPSGEEDTLEKELLNLVIRQSSNGIRFDHMGKHHDDRAFAVSMGVLKLIRTSGKREFLLGSTENDGWF